jgi:hypothetical protein
MTAHLESEEIARWQRARGYLLQVIDLVKAQIAHERCKRTPNREKLECLEAQISFVTDARYELSVHDEDAITGVLQGRVTLRNQQACIYPIAVPSAVLRSKFRECEGTCSPRDKVACQLLRTRSLTFPCIDIGSQSAAQTSP